MSRTGLRLPMEAGAGSTAVATPSRGNGNVTLLIQERGCHLVLSFRKRAATSYASTMVTAAPGDRWSVRQDRASPGIEAQPTSPGAVIAPPDPGSLTCERSDAGSFAHQVPVPEGDGAEAGGSDADRHHDAPCRPIRRHRGSRRHLMEERRVERPVTQCADAADDLDEQGPAQDAVDHDRGGPGPDAQGERADAEDADGRWDDVQPGAQHGGEAHSGVLAGRTEPDAYAGGHTARHQREGRDQKPPAQPRRSGDRADQEVVETPPGLFGPRRGDLAGSDEGDEHGQDQEDQAEIGIGIGAWGSEP